MKTIFSFMILLIIGLFASDVEENEIKQQLIQKLKQLEKKVYDKERENARLQNKLMDQEIYYTYTIKKQKEFDNELQKLEFEIFQYEENEKEYPKILEERKNKIIEYEEMIKQKQAKIDKFPEFEAQKNQKIQELQKQLAEKKTAHENEVKQQKTLWKLKFKEIDVELKKLKETENQLKLDLEATIASKIDFEHKCEILREEEKKRKEECAQEEDEEQFLKHDENFDQQSTNDTDSRKQSQDTHQSTDSDQYYTPQKSLPKKNNHDVFTNTNQKKKNIENFDHQSTDSDQYYTPQKSLTEKNNDEFFKLINQKKQNKQKKTKKTIDKQQKFYTNVEDRVTSLTNDVLKKIEKKPLDSDGLSNFLGEMLNAQADVMNQLYERTSGKNYQLPPPLDLESTKLFKPDGTKYDGSLILAQTCLLNENPTTKEILELSNLNSNLHRFVSDPKKMKELQNQVNEFKKRGKFIQFFNACQEFIDVGYQRKD